MSKADLKQMNKHPIQRYKTWWSRLSTIENRVGTRIMLIDFTRILVPEALRQKLLEREHVAHQGINKTSLDIAAKYFWPNYRDQVAKMCASCVACQRHGRSQPSEP